MKLQSQLKCNYDVELSLLFLLLCVCVEFMLLAQWWSGDYEIAVTVKGVIMMLCVQNSHSLLSGGQVTVKLQSS